MWSIQIDNENPICTSSIVGASAKSQFEDMSEPYLEQERSELLVIKSASLLPDG